MRARAEIHCEKAPQHPARKKTEKRERERKQAKTHKEIEMEKRE